MRTVSEEWGSRADIFFPSEKEKFLRFGDIVSLSLLQLFPGAYYGGMKLHRNSELVNIILEGTIGYQDSFGTVSSFPENTIQVISAGKGLYQMEYNPSNSILKKIQIELLPNVINTNPLQTKAIFNLEENINSLIELVSPSRTESSLSVRQDAAVLLGKFDADKHVGYTVNNNQIGLFVYVIDGTISIKNDVINAGEAIGINEEGEVMIHTQSAATVVIIETIISSEREMNSENIYGRN